MVHPFRLNDHHLPATRGRQQGVLGRRPRCLFGVCRTIPRDRAQGDTRPAVGIERHGARSAVLRSGSRPGYDRQEAKDHEQSGSEWTSHQWRQSILQVYSRRLESSYRRSDTRDENSAKYDVRSGRSYTASKNGAVEHCPRQDVGRKHRNSGENDWDDCHRYQHTRGQRSRRRREGGRPHLPHRDFQSAKHRKGRQGRQSRISDEGLLTLSAIVDQVEVATFSATISGVKLSGTWRSDLVGDEGDWNGEFLRE